MDPPPETREPTPELAQSETLPVGTEEALAVSDLDQLLKNLKLGRIAEILEREFTRMRSRQTSPRVLLARLFREQWQARQDTSRKNRIRSAKIPELYSLDTFPFEHQPSVSRSFMKELATLQFLAQGQNLVFIGEPGVGKTGLATSLLYQALCAGYRGLFIKAQDLFDEMYSSIADRSSSNLINRLARLPVLLVDEMGYLNLRPEQSNLFFRLMEERYTKRVTTIITTNLEFEAWYDFLGNKPMVEALLDRLRHRCTVLNMAGKSLREPESLLRDPQ
jgi:DNA replication protein DnaC